MSIFSGPRIIFIMLFITHAVGFVTVRKKSLWNAPTVPFEVFELSCMVKLEWILILMVTTMLIFTALL